MPNRLVRVSHTYFQSEGGEPVPLTCQCAVPLASAEDAYRRTTDVGEEAVPLDCGWIKGQASLVVVQNRTGMRELTNPTADRSKAVDDAVVEVALGSQVGGIPFALVGPRGRTAEFQPLDARTLWLRCRRGVAQVTVHVFPA